MNYTVKIKESKHDMDVTIELYTSSAFAAIEAVKEMFDNPDSVKRIVVEQPEESESRW